MGKTLDGLMKNAPLSPFMESIVSGLENDGERVLFAIVGEMTNKSTYGSGGIVFTEHGLVVCDDQTANRYLYSDMLEVKSKRMYGNAALSYVDADGRRRILFRYTYAISSLCDAAVRFIAHMRDGNDMEAGLEIMEDAFLRVLSVCKRCGRTLLYPGAECIMCRSKLKIAKHFFGYMRPHLPLIIFCIFLSLFTTAMALVPPAITGYIVDVVFPGGNGESKVHILNFINSFFSFDSSGTLVLMIVLLLLTYILQYSVGIVRSNLFRQIGNRSICRMRNDIYRKAQYLPMSFYDKTSTGAVISRIASDASNLQSFMLRITQEAVVHIFSLVGITVIMLTLNPYLTLFSLVPVVFIVIVTRFFAKRVRPLYRRIWRRWAAVFSHLSDSIPSIKIVKSFTGEKRSTEKFERGNAAWLEMDRRIGKLTTAFPQVISFLVTCGSLIIWAIGGSKVIEGEAGYSAGLIVSFISYAAMFYAPVTFFANLSDSFQSALASTEKILDILEAKSEYEAENAEIAGKFEGRVEFSHVTFSFDKTKKVLDDVSFSIEPGEIVGIVGTTGSGKSTLVNLLMRFYDGYSGDILVDGKDIKSYELSSYRSNFGYVQQEPQMFRDTIYNNIAYSRPDATVDEVIEAASVANAHGFIARQPDAYDTMLGERGVGVSGGEKQRISIARAVLVNPSLLVFDEATASVDSETEHLIQESIDRLIAGRTTIMIAHRLSTLKRANRIIVVDNGKIIENGTPDELIALRGKYYKLVEIQSMSQNLERMRKEEGFS